MTDDNCVVPGDFIGTSEEFLPGYGTYDEKGSIYASAVGTVQTNNKDMTVTVIPKKVVPTTIEVGDIVYGRVTDVKDSVVLVDISGIKGKEPRGLEVAEQAVVHISNVKDAYVSQLSYEFGFRDIIKAKVIDSTNMRLSTIDKNLGVIKSICSRCRGEMRRKEGEKEGLLECTRCRRVESRNLSEDYGMGTI
ncbi:MAG: exosome complex RNA-binding protein Csl4 [Halobacteriota archaeon]|nr:exosome complex RNA-binding protein Csl4 [Halobacteriota archaeon]